jgi:osmotically-inducible protein OsmY
MNGKKLAAVVAGAALAALAAGCRADDAGNANNANRANANAIVVNANNANAANANAANTSAYNRNYNTRADYNRDEANYRSEANRAGQSIGQGLEDGWIHFKVRAALAAVDDLRDSTINVDVDNNVVTLRGDVGSNAEKSAAEKAAKDVEGVRSVSNKLAVKPGGDANRNDNGNSNRK